MLDDPHAGRRGRGATRLELPRRLGRRVRRGPRRPGRHRRCRWPRGARAPGITSTSRRVSTFITPTLRSPAGRSRADGAPRPVARRLEPRRGRRLPAARHDPGGGVVRDGRRVDRAGRPARSSPIPASPRATASRRSTRAWPGRPQDRVVTRRRRVPTPPRRRQPSGWRRRSTGPSSTSGCGSPSRPRSAPSHRPLAGLHVSYPSASYVDDLPAVYSEDADVGVAAAAPAGPVRGALRRARRTDRRAALADRPPYGGRRMDAGAAGLARPAAPRGPRPRPAPRAPARAATAAGGPGDRASARARPPDRHRTPRRRPRPQRRAGVVVPARARAARVEPGSGSTRWSPGLSRPRSVPAPRYSAPARSASLASTPTWWSPSAPGSSRCASRLPADQRAASRPIVDRILSVFAPAHCRVVVDDRRGAGPSRSRDRRRPPRRRKRVGRPGGPPRRRALASSATDTAARRVVASAVARRPHRHRRLGARWRLDPPHLTMPHPPTKELT